jgi:RND family efflux transporter MFP subunit
MKCTARLVALAAIAALLAGCSAPADPPPPALRTVSAITVTATELGSTGTLAGEIRAQRQYDLAFRTSGRIIERLAEVGDHLTTGQVLARLDPQDLEANAALAAASVSAAEAQVEQASATFTRVEALFKQGLTTRARFDQARTSLESAKAVLTAAQSQKAAADEAVTYAELRAASSGIVLARNAEAGQVVGSGQAVYTIAEDGPRDAVFDVFHAALQGVATNIPVTIALLADPTITATGHVREISPTINTASGTIRVKVGLDADAAALPLGATVTGSIPLPSTPGFAVPWSALFRDGNGPAVWVADASGSVSLKPVTVARYSSDSVVIAEGLSDGDKVVIGGTQLLRPGEIVNIAEDSK